MAKLNKEEEKKKYPPIHELAIELLQEDPERHLFTIAKLYSRGGRLPCEALEGLTNAFEYAIERLNIDPEVDKAIERLHEQHKGK